MYYINKYKYKIFFLFIKKYLYELFIKIYL